LKRAGLVLVAALVFAAPAWANGDPASDVLLISEVFISPAAPVSKQAADELTKTVSSANQKGYKIRVAIIAFSGDLGTAQVLWRHPQNYAKFLGGELAFAYTGRLLIAMPSGFGFYNGKKPVAKELRVLKSVPPGKTPTPLARSAAAAVRALATADGITVPKPSTGSTATRDRLILGAAVLAFLVVVFFPARLIRRRARGGAQSPSAGPR
jgi:hypothetical protein